MKLYLTRHGETEWNVARKLQGWGDSNLTEEGTRRAIKLGERLVDIDFDRIYSSPQGRALETARLIRGDKDTKIVTHDGLKELGLGLWEGMELDAIEDLYPNEYHLYRNKPNEYESLEGESFQDLFERVEAFLEEILAMDVENILIISHGITIKAIITIIKGLTLDEFSELPVLTGTALNICEVNGNVLEMILEDDTSHIEFGY